MELWVWLAVASCHLEVFGLITNISPDVFFYFIKIEMSVCTTFICFRMTVLFRYLLCHSSIDPNTTHQDKWFRVCNDASPSIRTQLFFYSVSSRMTNSRKLDHIVRTRTDLHILNAWSCLFIWKLSILYLNFNCGLWT